MSRQGGREPSPAFLPPQGGAGDFETWPELSGNPTDCTRPCSVLHFHPASASAAGALRIATMRWWRKSTPAPTGRARAAAATATAPTAARWVLGRWAAGAVPVLLLETLASSPTRCPCLLPPITSRAVVTCPALPCRRRRAWKRRASWRASRARRASGRVRAVPPLHLKITAAEPAAGLSTV